MAGLPLKRKHTVQREIKKIASTAAKINQVSDLRAASGAAKPVLGPEGSAALRDQLAAELKELNSAEEAANWAHRVMASKNTLIEADAALIEQAF